MPTPVFSSSRSGARRAASEQGGAAARMLIPTPLSAALAAALVTGAAAFAAPGLAQAASPVGGAWFAAGGARDAARSARPGLPPGARGDAARRQQMQSRQQLSRSIANLERAATAIAAQQAAQKAARAKAGKPAADVPDGLVEGGLVRADGSLAQWEGARAPKETVKGGQHTVTIKQTDSKAILAWESFNIGRKTTLDFQQKPTDAVLNKVVGKAGAKIAPSRIQGAIQADGTVMVVNQNGVVFSGTSQVNVRNLVAAATRVDETRLEGGRPVNVLDDAFRISGIYHDAFKVADDVLAGEAGKDAGKVRVDAGARIETAAPGNSTTGGGYALLLGKSVENTGTISTPRGQVALGAGDRFTIARGQGTAENQKSTTRGNQVTPTIAADSEAGTITNTGLLQAATGDVTLTGADVRQQGVALSTTSQDLRGTIHLTAVGNEGKVTLGGGKAAATAILLQDTDTRALDGQRDSLQAPVDLDTYPKDQDIVRADAYRRDLSLVEIVSSGTVDFEGGSSNEAGSLTLATGGQIAVQAAKRTLVRDGAVLDVSGAIGVKVAMEANSLKINVQGNEQRDAPINRDSKNLNSTDVWVDRRSLIYVPADYDEKTNPNGYESDRWYTAGGLLEVGGYLGTTGRGVGEWMAQGGMVRFGGGAAGGGEVVTQAGSQINLSGGTLDVQGGSLRQSWLRGADGRLYTVDRAPGDVLYEGLYQGYAQTSERWGHTRYFYNALIAPVSRREPGYTVGRDAGTLVIGTKSAVLEGQLIGDTYQGERQTQAPQQGLDGYSQSQTAAARGAQLIVGQYTPYYVKSSGTLQYGLTATADTIQQVILGAPDAIAAGLDLDTALPEEQQGVLYLDAEQLSEAGLGAVRIAARAGIVVDEALALGDGGELTLYAPSVEVDADLTAHGGRLQLGNVLYQIDSNAQRLDTRLGAPEGVAEQVRVGEGVTLDASGLWSNLLLDPTDIARLPYRNGGTVSIRSTGDVTLNKNSLVDVSSGAAVLADGRRQGGKGGDITLEAGALQPSGGTLTLGGSLRGYGVDGGGTLRIVSGDTVAITGESLLAKDGTLQAGESVDLSLVLDEEYTVEAGEVLPVDVVLTRFERIQVEPGGALPIPLDLAAYIRDVGPLLVVGEWTLPTNSGYIDLRTADGEAYRVGRTIPANTVITAGTGTLSAGTVMPAVAFPDGFLLPPSDVEYRHAAGTLAPESVVLAAGTVIHPSVALERDAAVRPVLELPPGFFDKGFARYEVVGAGGLTVVAGSQVAATVPVYRYTEQSWTVPGGAAPVEALELWTPPLYQDDPAAAHLIRRGGASLMLQAGNTYSTQDGMALQVGAGAQASVDPGQSIELRTAGRMAVDGTLQAPSGELVLGSVTLQSLSNGGEVRGDPAGHGRAIWIGEHAVLDVAGRAVTRLDAQGRPVNGDGRGRELRDPQGQRYGTVLSGGRIVIGSDFDPSTATLTDPAGLFVVVREGARLDASGAQAVLDVPGQGATRVASEGGDIVLASSNGLYLDGTLRAESGGAGAAGGRLTVALDTPQYDADTAETRVRQARELLLTQRRQGSPLADDADPISAAPQLEYGHGLIAARQVSDGGFDSLVLASDGVLSFDGDVVLNMNRSLDLYARVLGLGERAPQDTDVVLAAPYIRLAGYGGGIGGDNVVHPTLSGGEGAAVSGRPLAGRLQLQAGQVLEVRDLVNIGAQAAAGTDGLAAAIDRRGFDSVELGSGGDLRFLAGTRAADGTALYAPGDLALTAAQLYPATHAEAEVHAGWRGRSAAYDPDRVLTVARSTGDVPAAPYSVFGSLTLAAATVEQGGVVRAPLGRLLLGVNSGASRRTRQVDLLDGSLTSVSAAGLVMPYGGTRDGVTWSYDGAQVELQGAGSLQAGSVTLTGQQVTAQKGAVIDLSGGGELTGAGFVSGRGGSTDARYQPLVQRSGEGFVLPGLGTNPVYAIVPTQAGAQPAAAPAGGEAGAVDPLPGQQITIGAGVPGLPAGTYTLLPSTYALLPGAFRVELNGLAGGNGQVPAPTAAGGRTGAPAALRNGSWAAAGTLSVFGTGIRDSVARQVILTPADMLRRHSQYDETSYAAYAAADAARLGVPRAQTEADAKTMVLQFPDREPGGAAVALRFDGTMLDEAARGGRGSTLAVVGTGTSSRIEILGAGPASADYGISLRARDLSAAGADRLVIGGLPGVRYGQEGSYVQFSGTKSYIEAGNGVAVRSGAVLSAPEVMLVARGGESIGPGDIVIERGAAIDALGRGAPAYDSGDGFLYRPGSASVVSVSNGRQQWLAPQAEIAGNPGPIRVGVCAAGNCVDATRLYSEGTIAFVTDSAFELDDAVRFGTRHLSLAVGAFNIGTSQALADARARGALTQGLVLNQTVMQRLLQGDTSVGAPALETLELIAGQSVNFLESVTLSTLDARGRSLLDNLMLTTPAIYGYGGADDVARIETGHLIWNGATEAPGPVAAEGAGTGSGTFEIDAERITFGYGPWGQPDGVSSLDRLALGFAGVSLAASDRISANHAGTLSVYQRQGAYVEGEGEAYSGGNLSVVTPLWTGEPGSVNEITAGGAIRVSAPASGTVDPAKVADLGGELSLTAGRGLSLNTTVALPSGKLTLAAEGDVTLGNRAHLDLSGRAVTFFDDKDATQYSWGGDVTLESTAGSIRQSAGSTIDLSAEYNQAGRLTAIALDEGADAGSGAGAGAGADAGDVDLQGRILGRASGYYEAGGTYVPYQAGGIEVRARTLGGGADLSEGFAMLNTRLNQGEVFGSRAFQLKEGSLTIRNEAGTGTGDTPARANLKANQIEVSVDGGRLTVAGMVDASGERVGSIRLAGKRGLTIGGNALLDAHGTLLRVDSYGQIIDAPNRAIIELNSGDGVLTLADGSRMDLRYGTGDARYKQPALRKLVQDRGALGTVELFAPRIDAGENANTADAATHGDVAIDARGDLTIRGARSIALNAVQRYDDAPDGTDESAGGKPYQVIDQAYLNAKHNDSTDFIDNALANGDLLNTKLSGLNNATYRNVLHLRPGVEIVSKTPDGDLVVSGDLDLSGYRYDSLNPLIKARYVADAAPGDAGYGSGEPGALAIRAGGDLNIYGSINDGFAPPPDTPDDDGWVLKTGIQGYAGDVVVPGAGVELAAGTEFPAGRALNYAVPIEALTLPSGTMLPTQAALAADLELPVGTVLGAAVRDADGRVIHPAGTVLDTPTPGKSTVTLPAGSLLDAGLRLPRAASLAAMTWPAGVKLPMAVTLAEDVPLSVGALIPSMTDVKLADDATSAPLRAADGGRMGRNWAVAAMLPEGSLSWGLRLVAGADTEAVDPRLARPGGSGRLVLADTHYGSYTDVQEVLGGVWYWGPDAADWGGTPDTPVDEGSMWACDSGAACMLVTRVWGPEGAGWGGGPEGTPIADDDPMAWACDMGPGVCLDVGDPAGTVVTPYLAAQNFSVLRTGTGDLDLIAGGDVAMESLYGVYTAGMSTASRAGSQAGAFDRARGKAGDGSYLNTRDGVDPARDAAYEALVDGGEDSTYAAWYPDGGGNLLLRAGGTLTGDMLAMYRPGYPHQDVRAQRSSVDLGNWLWRQASGGTAGVDDIPASWWINFGTYVPSTVGVNGSIDGMSTQAAAAIRATPELVGFTGFGTLGGGNLAVQVGGDAGILARRGNPVATDSQQRSQGLVLAVAGTGRVTADGKLLLTGGGDLDLRVGGSLNPNLPARAVATNAADGIEPESGADYVLQNIDTHGMLANLRGALRMQAGQAGGVGLTYYSYAVNQVDRREMRAYDAWSPSLGAATGGPVLMLGDASATLATRGDLVVSGSGDPGRVALPYAPPYRVSGAPEDSVGGYGWFSLWTANTAIDLFSAGGNLAPSVQIGDMPKGETGAAPASGHNVSPTDGRYVWPSQLGAVAPGGSVYLGESAVGLLGNDMSAPEYSLLLAPSALGRLAILAGDSIYAGGYTVSQSGAGVDALPTPMRPAFAAFTGTTASTLEYHNLAPDGVRPAADRFPLFAFGPETAVAVAAGGAPPPARLYARDGDIVGLGSGAVLTFATTSSNARPGQTWYEGAGPVWMRAGRDIVRSGTMLDESTSLSSQSNPLTQTPSNSRGSPARVTGNLFLHRDATDVSIVEAGRDILFSNFNVAGPGTLEVTAGRNIVMAGQAGQTLTGVPVYGETMIRSLGPVVPGDTRPGAGIVVQAGLGAAGVNGADYAGFLDLYLDPANLAEAGRPLAEQPGKVAETYEDELIDWLAQRYGFEGGADEALVYFAALPSEQQRIFARQVYFAELRAGGREYNDADGPRFGSYLRGRNAIAALFPEKTAAGEAIVYQGDLLLYGGAGIHTDAGGSIQVLTPGGAQTYGVEGEEPPETAGVITRGQGDIQMYSLGSILLGQSRIMTTFGGDILAWSAEGDINAGRGSKTTVVYTPPRRVYDDHGNVTLSPDVPSTGAGIATLNPIPEVPPGDVDLIAPLGTIDAGEAGIRVSGNVNLAALQVVNAANIQVQGEATGIPVLAAVNVGALTGASAAATSAATAASDAARGARAAAQKSLPSIISVQILGFGDAASPPAPPRPAPAGSSGPAAYRPDGMVQVVDESALSAGERRRFGM